MRVKELHLTMTLRNNRVLSRRTELGLSAKAAAEKCGVSYHTWLDFERLKQSPYGRAPGFGGRVGLRPQAQRIADGLGVTVDWLWPDAVLDVTCPTIAKELDAQDLRPALTSAQMVELPAPADEQMERAESVETLRRWIEACTAREEGVLRARYGLDDGVSRTIREVGDMYGLSNERIRQIEARAFSKIRKAAHAEGVRDEFKENINAMMRGIDA